jgi:hypothetical protein
VTLLSKPCVTGDHGTWPKPHDVAKKDTHSWEFLVYTKYFFGESRTSACRSLDLHQQEAVVQMVQDHR